MTEYVLALVPEYGLYLIFIVVMIACLGIPLPSAILVLTSGSLAAAEDLNIWQVFAVTFFAFSLGDQLSFNVARWAGPSLLVRMQKINRLSLLIVKSERMLDKHGALAIVLSRTIFSPVGPYIAYVSGAVRMSWPVFSSSSVIGAFLWTTAYTLMGYLFATDLPQVSNLVISAMVVSISAIGAICCGIWLMLAWKKFESTDVSTS
ncbi:DedA family protein [Marinomonas sp. C2222]|uniref:DedA family protein n=1 Tax=Marinomonas sargassi TaxID=2984494 RepID=A0ABT2YVR0_9GAMM|nr:DedA family protein [Marinomonas sargassi]MCV2403972.1 DedA family protein [Marinomonas sargassi]